MCAANEEHEKIEKTFLCCSQRADSKKMRWSKRLVEKEGRELADMLRQIPALASKDANRFIREMLITISEESCLLVRLELFYDLCCFILSDGRARLPTIGSILQEKIDTITPPERRFDIMRAALAYASTC